MRTAGSVLVTMLVVAALFLVGTLGAFGLGAGRPFGIVLILAAFGLLRRLSFRVTVNTDNRLMSGVTLSSEFRALTEAFGYGWADIEWLTINAMKSAFAPFDERLEIINKVIKPGFAMVRRPAVP